MTNTTDRTSSTQCIELPDGREIAFEGHGDPAGRPVLFLGAAPSSRLLDPDPPATRSAGIRLITCDRPGYGGSSALPAGRAPSWGMLADDLAVALDALGIDRVSVVGWSNGGIGALAFAARHPHRVTRAVVTGAPAPHEEVPWIPEQFVGFLAQLRQEPSTAVATLAPMLGVSDLAEAVSQTGGGVDDERTLTDSQVRSSLEAMLVEAYRQGGAGVATDIVATNVVPWGFDLAAVRSRVTLLYGGSDAIVPSAHGAWYAARLADAELEVVQGTGHLLPLTHWGRVLEATK